MKTLLRSAIIGAGLTLAATTASLAVEIQVGHTLTTDSHYQAAALKFKEVVEAGSKGAITVNIFPQSQLGGEVKMIQSARTGAIAAFITAAPPLENTVQEYSILSLPYLFDDLDQANTVMQGPFGEQMLKQLDSRGLVGLTFLSSFERSVFGSRAIRKVEDFKGMKIRVLQGPGFIRTYEALGAQPTPMAYSEVFVALQNGVVDGAEADPAQVVQDKFVEVTKFFNFTKIHYMPSLLVFSKARFDALTKEQQELVRSAAKQAAKASLEAYKKTYAEGVEGMKKAKVELIYPDLAPFKQVARGVWPSLLTAVPNGDALLKDAQAALKTK
ncbi:TRAP transporter substrate-binding protein [Xanthobacter sp. V3C-3]|uniref:TRAP transporter substrate-binding protein n=1 Tax=Xanthobacter lutulentifluminis TaxID=3119935 RepID=UPI0037268B50